jgi:hypothetical protein
MPKGPTVYDVAERAGVSVATVSFAFRRPEKVSRPPGRWCLLSPGSWATCPAPARVVSRTDGPGRSV